MFGVGNPRYKKIHVQCNFVKAVIRRWFSISISRVPAENLCACNFIKEICAERLKSWKWNYNLKGCTRLNNSMVLLNVLGHLYPSPMKSTLGHWCIGYVWIQTRTRQMNGSWPPVLRPRWHLQMWSDWTVPRKSTHFHMSIHQIPLPFCRRGKR